MTSRLLPLAPWPGATPARLGLLPHSQSCSLMPPSPNGLVGPSFFPAIKPSSDIEISNTTFPVSRRLRSGLRPDDTAFFFLVHKKFSFFLLGYITKNKKHSLLIS